MKGKKLLSLALSGVLAASLAIPAFATSTNITGAYEDIEIAVLVPTTGTAQINPYGLPVKLTTANKSIVNEQIVTKPLAIANKSEVDLAVSASVVATANGDLKFVEAAPLAGDTSKSAFVYLQMKPERTLLESALNTEKTGFTDTVLDTAAAAWKQAYNADKDLVLNGREAGSSKENMVFLKKASTTGGNVTIAQGGGAMFRLSGSVVSNPREAWTESDGFNATVAFTFRPDTTKVVADKTAVTVKVTSSDPAHTAVVNLTDFTTDEVGFATDAANITWSVTEGSANASVAKDGTDPKKATITGDTVGTAVVTASVIADNGLTYTLDIPVTVEA